jgi:hypothetical protein
MIYFIVTTSVFKNCHIRESQYINGINTLKKYIKNSDIMNFKIVIVENNGYKNTFLNNLNCDVLYTTNNFLKTSNKGYKELQDILECIEKFHIKDTDFIVKMTGRYILGDDSEFMHVIKRINESKYDCVIKYGSYLNPVGFKMNDCITGLIGMTCKFIKKIDNPKQNECVEWKWAEIACSIADEKVFKVNKLGINICPGSNIYFEV